MSNEVIETAKNFLENFSAEGAEDPALFLIPLQHIGDLLRIHQTSIPKPVEEWIRSLSKRTIQKIINAVEAEASAMRVPSYFDNDDPFISHTIKRRDELESVLQAIAFHTDFEVFAPKITSIGESIKWITYVAEVEDCLGERLFIGGKWNRWDYYSDHMMVGYINAGKHAKRIEAFAKKDSEFASELRGCIEGFLDTGEIVSKQARAWFNAQS